MAIEGLMHEKEDRERIQRRTVVPAGNGSEL